MITIEQLEKLRKFKIGSWAIFKKNKNEGYLNFFANNINYLHGNVIFLGLNRSKKKKGLNIYTNSKYEFQNFQKVNRLQRCIKGKYLYGSYITDFYKKDINPNSIELKHKSLRQKRLALKFLFKQIEIFNLISNKICIIAFGDIVYNHLKDSLKWVNEDEIKIPLNINNHKLFNIKKISGEFYNYELNIFRVCHYSQKNRGEIYNLILRKQLRYINNYLKNE